MGLVRGNARNQSLLVCLVTFLIGVVLIALHLRWDIPAVIARNSKPAAAPAKATSMPAPNPAPPSVPVTAAPVPAPSPGRGGGKAALLKNLQSAFGQLRTLEADIFTSGATGQLTAVGQFFMTKQAGKGIERIEDMEAIRVRVDYSAVPVTKMVVVDGKVNVYQPTRRSAVTRDVDEAVEDWLKDYVELLQNIEVTLVNAADLKARNWAALEIVPRQPTNIKRAVISIDLGAHLPVHFDVEFPLRRQIVAFHNMKVDQSIDPKVFSLTLPAGMKWTPR